MAKVIVKKSGRTWGVYVDGELIEGGFFNRDCAMDAAAELKQALDREDGR